MNPFTFLRLSLRAAAYFVWHKLDALGHKLGFLHRVKRDDGDRDGTGL